MAFCSTDSWTWYRCGSPNRGSRQIFEAGKTHCHPQSRLALGYFLASQRTTARLRRWSVDHCPDRCGVGHVFSKVDEAKALTGAVVVRVLDTRAQVTYMPPSYGPTFWGYCGDAWPIAYDPGYCRTDQVVLVETSIFSLTRDRLLWVGTTETLNPRSLPDTVNDIAKAVRSELLRRDLIPPS
jgi:hypothetical protein